MKMPPVTVKAVVGAGAAMDATVIVGAFGTMPLHHTSDPPE